MYHRSGLYHKMLSQRITCSYSSHLSHRVKEGQRGNKEKERKNSAECFISSLGLLPQPIFSQSIEKSVINKGYDTAVTPLY